jgi:DNA-directed RNA polymerase subunit RPC12/RpoP
MNNDREQRIDQLVEQVGNETMSIAEACKAVYEEHGQQAVTELAESIGGIATAYCDACCTDTPANEGECLVCGSAVVSDSNSVKESYLGGVCPDCGEDIPDYADEGEECTNCGHVFSIERADDDFNFDDSLDGDFDTGMASAGFGTDEDYGYYGDD